MDSTGCEGLLSILSEIPYRGMKMKINWRTTGTLAVSSLFLAGCAVSSLPEIKSQTPPGGEYEANLHEGYVELAEMEAGRGK